MVDHVNNNPHRVGGGSPHINELVYAGMSGSEFLAVQALLNDCHNIVVSGGGVTIVGRSVELPLLEMLVGIDKSGFESLAETHRDHAAHIFRYLAVPLRSSEGLGLASEIREHVATARSTQPPHMKGVGVDFSSSGVVLSAPPAVVGAPPIQRKISFSPAVQKQLELQEEGLLESLLALIEILSAVADSAGKKAPLASEPMVTMQTDVKKQPGGVKEKERKSDASFEKSSGAHIEAHEITQMEKEATEHRMTREKRMDDIAKGAEKEKRDLAQEQKDVSDGKIG